eukprot:CAMPEP_0178989614 /NCGR_PEP_ID=MMETSP0795-20121207/4477_1 /TAXON_ID=88552 /ORGANISM="Amoebophrya sp., Strain Ameob2" /LENGTH=1168 /DNA_ID=CAMNT_0020681045 /DNA_START=44 /DNA_END=3551 /DNA_ORIENTATION=-
MKSRKKITPRPPAAQEDAVAASARCIKKPVNVDSPDETVTTNGTTTGAIDMKNADGSTAQATATPPGRHSADRSHDEQSSRPEQPLQLTSIHAPGVLPALCRSVPLLFMLGTIGFYVMMYLRCWHWGHHDHDAHILYEFWVLPMQICFAVFGIKLILGTALSRFVMERCARKNWRGVFHGFVREHAEETEGLTQCVILPNYKEEVDTMSDTINAIAAASRDMQIVLVLAMEAREGVSAHEKAGKLVARHAHQFRKILVNFHEHNEFEGEVAGKSSNTQAGWLKLQKWLADEGVDVANLPRAQVGELRREGVFRPASFVQQNNLDKRQFFFHSDRTFVTVCDVDVLLHEHYFHLMSLQALTGTSDSEARKWKIWQSCEHTFRNFESAPGVSRAAAMGGYLCFMSQLGFAGTSLGPGLPLSSYTVSLHAAEFVGGWDVDVIAEDHHMYLKLLLWKEFYYAGSVLSVDAENREARHMKPVQFKVTDAMMKHHVQGVGYSGGSSTSEPSSPNQVSPNLQVAQTTTDQRTRSPTVVSPRPPPRRSGGKVAYCGDVVEVVPVFLPFYSYIVVSESGNSWWRDVYARYQQAAAARAGRRGDVVPAIEPREAVAALPAALLRAAVRGFAVSVSALEVNGSAAAFDDAEPRAHIKFPHRGDAEPGAKAARGKRDAAAGGGVSRRVAHREPGAAGFADGGAAWLSLQRVPGAAGGRLRPPLATRVHEPHRSGGGAGADEDSKSSCESGGEKRDEEHRVGTQRDRCRRVDDDGLGRRKQQAVGAAVAVPVAPDYYGKERYADISVDREGNLTAMHNHPNCRDEVFKSQLPALARRNKKSKRSSAPSSATSSSSSSSDHDAALLRQQENYSRGSERTPLLRGEALYYEEHEDAIAEDDHVLSSHVKPGESDIDNKKVTTVTLTAKNLLTTQQQRPRKRKGKRSVAGTSTAAPSSSSAAENTSCSSSWSSEPVESDDHDVFSDPGGLLQTPTSTTVSGSMGTTHDTHTAASTPLGAAAQLSEDDLPTRMRQDEQEAVPQRTGRQLQTMGSPGHTAPTPVAQARYVSTRELSWWGRACLGVQVIFDVVLMGQLSLVLFSLLPPLQAVVHVCLWGNKFEYVTGEKPRVGGANRSCPARVVQACRAGKERLMAMGEGNEKPCSADDLVFEAAIKEHEKLVTSSQ